MADNKKQIRREKKVRKREGNKRKRNFYKKQLAENPDEVDTKDDFEVGGARSDHLNGQDDDSTRKKKR